MTRINKGDVSVVVTAYKHESFIRECLDSILNQTFQPSKLIVIDDCSQDRTKAICLDWLEEACPKFEVVFKFHEQNLGICKSLNEALLDIDTNFYCHVSADDWIEPARLESQLKAAQNENTSTSLIISSIREVDINGETIVDHDFGEKLSTYSGLQVDGSLHTKLLRENIIPAPAVLIRTNTVREIGGYDESLAFEDYDLWLRLSKVSKILYVDEIVANYRILNTSMLRNKNRFATLKLSEAEMLFKHAGQSDENDRIISERINGIKQEIIYRNAGMKAVRSLNSMIRKIRNRKIIEASN